MKNSLMPLLRGAALCLLCSPLLPAFAAPEEIQVYLDDVSEAGHFGLDVHNNYALSATRVSDYRGEQAPRHVLRVTPEFYYGITANLELGIYVLTTRSASGEVHYDGGKVRLKYIAPHDATQGMFWGANIEVGSTDIRVSQYRRNAELKGILGYRTGPWLLAVNPNFDWALSSGGGQVGFGLDGKLGYALSGKTTVGVESYNEMGSARRIQAFSRNPKAVYAVIDQEVGRFDINAGIGRGLASVGDRWVAKLIVGTHF
jgi:hypothetical protein